MRKFYLPIMLTIILLPVAGRFVLHGFDATFFIVAGRHFTDPSKLPFPVTVVDGAGYDGQFYFKTALDFALPSGTAISYDDPIYRKQRILYPALAWLAAFGVPALIPFTLIVINCLAMLLVWKVFYDLCKEKNIPVFYSLLPALYSGIPMSIARDLADPLETLLILGVLRFGISNPALFFIFSGLALLTKETSLVFILPAACVLGIKFWQEKASPWRYLWLILPPILPILWKYFLENTAGSTLAVHGAYNLTYPLTGLIAGFTAYPRELTLKNVSEYALALFSLGWLAWLVVLTAPHIKTAMLDKFKGHYAESGWLSWLVFSMFFSVAIYEDDWSFVRLFSAFSTVSYLILFQNSEKPGVKFIAMSVLMYIVITARLWLRV